MRNMLSPQTINDLPVHDYQDRREQVFDWTVSLESDKLKYLRERLALSDVQLLHHKFELNGGSVIEILAESVFIEDAISCEQSK
jgi:hypothetical protein